MERFRHCLLAENGAEELTRITQIRRVGVQFQLPRFQLGQVENVVDQVQQRRAAVADGPHILRLLRRQPVWLQQFAEAENGVHGAANLMAHVGEEGALLPHRLFCLQLLFQQLPPPSFLEVINPVEIERDHPRPNTEQPGHPRHLMHQLHLAAGRRSGGGDQIQPVVTAPFDHLADALHGCFELRRNGGCLWPRETLPGVQLNLLSQLRQFNISEATQFG